MIQKATTLLAALALVAIAGCRVHVDKSANGQSKDVQVDTPFGGVHVNTDQTTAADLGLPVYPGAQETKDSDGKHKSADVHLGFGEWEMHVQVVSYSTPDSRQQVIAFYKKALGRYGDVLTCQNNAAIGAPAATAQGLTCKDSNSSKVQVQSGDYSFGGGKLELKAGSFRHQHIVGFESTQNGKTHFALVALDLPAGLEGHSDKSN
ncbi:MAG: hypothetical protein ACRD3N_15260 [Terracidiphilus sp.]